MTAPAIGIWCPGADGADAWIAAIGAAGTIAYRSVDDAAVAVRAQEAKWGLPIGAAPRPLPDVWGVYMPSAGPESSEAGAWLPPHDEDGPFETALVFLARDDAERVLEWRRPGPFALPADSFVAPFAWDSAPERCVHRGEGR